MISISHERNLQRVFVRQRNNQYYFPRTIPRERKSMTNTFVALLVLIGAVHFCLSDNRFELPGVYSLITAIYLIICLIYRLILYVYELKHVHTRYEDDKIQVLKAALFFKVGTYILAGFCVVYLVYYKTRHAHLPSLQDDYWCLIVPFLFFLHRLLDMDDFPINDSLWIAKDDGLDYGSGMAYSFFYGYLKYMLEKTGQPNKNLKEMMEDYESKNNITFAVYKIFILIPKSLSCFDSIENVSKIMEMRSTLPEKKITVAGVRNRVYKNSVYTIARPGSELVDYVCTEYATPLKTFAEVFRHNTAHTTFYHRHRNDILLRFYLTLEQILRHNSMNNMCELVFYEDMDSQNNYYDVGRILLNKIAEINRAERPHDQ